ncbi:uncharacterized protein LOC107863758 isoform X15 [Capsicum annuum]|uniref:uncharacterized protein LOC107863758 isoform X15 n=1 Tax=Capsicum annuum TaxID=4072 RepID=UPI001FB1377F|nr:uncharacterized protein LOC107863758 isoform X15 [Capsicum annuum]
MAANAFLEDPTWDENDYPMIAPLLSYGRGGDTDVGRFISLIFGTNLTDVVITGQDMWISSIRGQRKVHGIFCRPRLLWWWYSYLKGNSKTGRAGENAVNDIFVILSDSWLDNDEVYMLLFFFVSLSSFLIHLDLLWFLDPPFSPSLTTCHLTIFY